MGVQLDPRVAAVSLDVFRFAREGQRTRPAERGRVRVAWLAGAGPSAVSGSVVLFPNTGRWRRKTRDLYRPFKAAARVRIPLGVLPWVARDHALRLGSRTTEVLLTRSHKSS